MMKMIPRIYLQLLAVHTTNYCFLSLKAFIQMGNDILNKQKHEERYIHTRRLAPSNSQKILFNDSFEKIFGKPEEHTLKKNHTVSFLIPNSIIEQQNTFQQATLPQIQQTSAQTSNNIQQSMNSQNETIIQLQQQISRLKQLFYEQNYLSKSYSPVKKEPEKQQNKEINKSDTKNRRHYFKLKGCEKKEQEKENNFGRVK